MRFGQKSAILSTQGMRGDFLAPNTIKGSDFWFEDFRPKTGPKTRPKTRLEACPKTRPKTNPIKRPKTRPKALPKMIRKTRPKKVS